MHICGLLKSGGHQLDTTAFADLPDVEGHQNFLTRLQPAQAQG
jgi:hypothetical protein